MLNKITKALGFNSENNDKSTYIGQGFNKGIIDSARTPRTYEYYELITDGEHKGKYKPVLRFGHLSGLRNEKEEAEMMDIYRSGKDIYAFDPKADPADFTDDAIAKRTMFIESQGRSDDLNFITGKSV